MAWQSTTSATYDRGTGDTTIWSTWTDSRSNHTYTTTWSKWNDPTAFSTEMKAETTMQNGEKIWSTWVSHTTDFTMQDREREYQLRHHQEYVQNHDDRRTLQERQRDALAQQSGRGIRAQQERYAGRGGEVYRQALREEELVRREAKATKLKEEKLLAETRAKELLLDLIGEEELKVYSETGRLFVKGKKFDYILQKTGFIQRIEKNKIVDMCVHLDNRFKFPETDNVVAMKLAIEEDEKGILKLANDHGSVKRPAELRKAACM